MRIRLIGRCSAGNIFLIVCLSAVIASGCAKTSKTGDGATAAVEETDPTFKVPDGSPETILKFVKDLSSRRPQFSDSQQGMDDMAKTLKAIIRAGDKVLSQKADDDALREATTLKLVGTIRLAIFLDEGDKNSKARAQEALAAVNRLRQDKRPVVALAANDFWIPARTLNLKSLSETERTDLIEEAMRITIEKLDNNASQQSLGDVHFLSEQLAKIGETQAAASLYDRIASIAEVVEDPGVKAMGQKLRGTANRIRLPGSQIEIAGKLMDGTELDWQSYQGKVVLVDFWATWCGPCLAELPSVRANFEKYHSRGFEVVGISIDHDRKKLETFLKSNPLPWVQVFDGDKTKSTGRQQSMADKFGVTSIPTMFLVGKDGKVVSVEARGEALEPLLIKLLGTEG